MKIRLLTLSIISFGIALMLTTTAAPNGINPPRPKESVTTMAFCHERAAGRQHEILRARITTGDKSTDLLSFRIGSASEKLSIAEMESVSLNAGSVDKDGFTTATLIRRGDSRKESVALQIRVNGSAYHLSGFTRSRSPINIEFGKCGRVEFSNSVDAAARQERLENNLPKSRKK